MVRDVCCCLFPCLSCLTGDDGGLKVQEIDAYWLQRRISQTLSNLDEHSAQKLAQEVLEALQVCGDWAMRRDGWRLGGGKGRW
jgi:hypothetical protein